MRTFGLRRRAVPLGLSRIRLAGSRHGPVELTGEADKS